jgi:hypothetical protein
LNPEFFISRMVFCIIIALILFALFYYLGADLIGSAVRFISDSLFSFKPRH